MRKAMAVAVLAATMTVGGAAGASAAKPKPRLLRLSATHARMSERVEFHGDAATGCADRGLCDTSGTIDYSYDASSGSGDILELGRQILGATLIVPADGLVDAHVQAAGAAPCHDERHVTIDGLVGLSHAGKVRFTPHFVGADVSIGAPILQTRCGGPLDEDIADALPTLDVSLSTLTKPVAHLHFQRTAPFAAGGLAGTVTTDLLVTLHHARTHKKQ